MKKFLLLIICCIFLYSCKSNNPVSSDNEIIPANYVKVDSVYTGSWKFVLWSATSSKLNYGYNEIGFKVYNGATEMKDGYFKYIPVMTHIGVSGHGCPVKSNLSYNSDLGLFNGYVCLTMYSDSVSVWKASYDYNGAAKIDSVPFYINNSSNDYIRIWTDLAGSNNYIMTLVSPLTPQLGLNNYSVMLHSTHDDVTYTEIDNASFGILVWMVAHGHTSSNNINPVSKGGGKYTGQVNFTMSGGWTVYDTIKVGGTDITNNNPPRFNFKVE